MPAIITFTTDFGADDAFVAAMKGVVLGINPDATLVDVTHDIPPQSVTSGAFVLSTAYPYFPPGAIHVAVVDPGVGTERPAILIKARDTFFLAPDNGLLTYVLADYAPAARAQSEPFSLYPVRLPPDVVAYHIRESRYFRHPVSDTFHGRDIFSPVAGHLSRGVEPHMFGPRTESILAFAIPEPYREGETIIATILHVDRFGNLITNLRREDLPRPDVIIEIAGREIEGVSRSYAAGPELVAVVGSAGFLEVAVKNGNASRALGAGLGARLRVVVPG